MTGLRLSFDDSNHLLFIQSEEAKELDIIPLEDAQEGLLSAITSIGNLLSEPPSEEELQKYHTFRHLTKAYSVERAKVFIALQKHLPSVSQPFVDRAFKENEEITSFVRAINIRYGPGDNLAKINRLLSEELPHSIDRIKNELAILYKDDIDIFSTIYWGDNLLSFCKKIYEQYGMKGVNYLLYELPKTRELPHSEFNRIRSFYVHQDPLKRLEELQTFTLNGQHQEMLPIIEELNQDNPGQAVPLWEKALNHLFNQKAPEASSFLVGLQFIPQSILEVDLREKNPLSAEKIASLMSAVEDLNLLSREKDFVAPLEAFAKELRTAPSHLIKHYLLLKLLFKAFDLFSQHPNRENRITNRALEVINLLLSYRATLFPFESFNLDQEGIDHVMKNSLSNYLGYSPIEYLRQAYPEEPGPHKNYLYYALLVQSLVKIITNQTPDQIGETLQIYEKNGVDLYLIIKHKLWEAAPSLCHRKFAAAFTYFKSDTQETLYKKITFLDFCKIKRCSYKKKSPQHTLLEAMILQFKKGDSWVDQSLNNILFKINSKGLKHVALPLRVYPKFSETVVKKLSADDLMKCRKIRMGESSPDVLEVLGGDHPLLALSQSEARERLKEGDEVMWDAILKNDSQKKPYDQLTWLNVADVRLFSLEGLFALLKRKTKNPTKIMASLFQTAANKIDQNIKNKDRETLHFIIDHELADYCKMSYIKTEQLEAISTEHVFKYYNFQKSQKEGERWAREAVGSFIRSKIISGSHDFTTYASENNFTEFLSIKAPSRKEDLDPSQENLLPLEDDSGDEFEEVDLSVEPEAVGSSSAKIVSSQGSLQLELD